MKKKLVSAMLVSAMLASVLAGCGGADDSSDTQKGSSAKGGTDGSVYMLNFKPETDEAWQELAQTYTDQTGVDVRIVTAADGQYDTTLQSEMAKSDAPTIFTIGSTTDAGTWDEYTYDLKDSSIYSHLSDKSLSITYNDKIAGVANCYECYGIIFNKTILEGYCGMDNAVVSSVDEINSFDKLKAVADDINSRIDEINEKLGTDLTEAFASAGLDDGSSWRFSGHLANMPVWDMYVSDSAADPKTLNSGALNAESELGMGEAVFYQNGDWEYSALTNPDNGYTVTADDLSMMPIYFGVDDENEGLCVGTENYWAVNSKASQDDIDATLAFLDWVITSDEGRDAITNKMGITAPFDTFTGDYETSNAFAQASNALMAAGKTSVAWSFNATPNVDDWRADVVAPLAAYTAGEGSWDDVVTAFVDGWANQWKLAHEEN